MRHGDRCELDMILLLAARSHAFFVWNVVLEGLATAYALISHDQSLMHGISTNIGLDQTR
jgi:hypothetical protein